MIPLDLLDENPLNPRRSMDEAALNELAQSIKNSGITQPLLVRVQHIDGLIEERYEIVCGHRRAAAAYRLELLEVPCNVREMNDQEAAEIALVDNLQRVDVAALDEAEAFGALLALHGTVEAVAKRVGKEVGHVAKRLKLRTLGIHQRDSLRAKLITVDHALLLAKLGVAEQDEALKWCLDTQAGSKKPVEQVVGESVKYLRSAGRYRLWEPESVVRLREHIEQSVGRKLSRAPWSLDDVTLVQDAGACNTCPNNTKANTALFSDLDMEEATCADGACFERKREVFVQIKLAAAAAASKTAVRLSWKQTSTPPRMDIGTSGAGPSQVPKLTQVFKAGQWLEAKKGSCASILTGVTVDWSDDANRGYMGTGKKLRKPGESIQVCVAAKCKAHRKEYEKPKDSGQGAGSRDPKADAEAAAKRESDALVESRLRVAVAAKALEGITKLPIDALRAMAIHSLPNWQGGRKVHEELVPGIVKILSEAKLDSVQFFRALAAATLDRRAFEVGSYLGSKVTEDRAKFLAAIKRLGYDGSGAWVKPKGSDQPTVVSGQKKATKKPAKKAAKKGAKR
jgi:ParB/RepB/Spo0J family partition protein